MVRDVSYAHSIDGKICVYANVFYLSVRISSSLLWLPAYVASRNAVRAVGNAPLTFIHESAAGHHRQRVLSQHGQQEFAASIGVLAELSFLFLRISDKQ